MSNAGAAGGAPIVRFADIIFARDVPDPTGQNLKTRRVVVLTPDAALAAGYPIVAAAVTGTLPAILTAEYVPLPYKNPPGTRHPKTGLTKRAAVHCTWLVTVPPDDVMGYRSGFVPAAYMKGVISKTATTARTMGGWP
jgi:mRNA-degrading endonuclease toxin of MazEF toxin-antitoxin module